MLDLDGIFKSKNKFGWYYSIAVIAIVAFDSTAVIDLATYDRCHIQEIGASSRFFSIPHKSREKRRQTYTGHAR